MDGYEHGHEHVHARKRCHPGFVFMCKASTRRVIIAIGKNSHKKGKNGMNDILKTDYTLLDRPEILNFLFHPRAAAMQGYARGKADPCSVTDHMIPVSEGDKIGARFHMTSQTAPSILFFMETGKSYLIMTNWDLFTINWASIFCRWTIAATAFPRERLRSRP